MQDILTINTDMREVEERACDLAPTEEATIPTGFFETLDESDDEALDDTVDKAATPAERIWNVDTRYRQKWSAQDHKSWWPSVIQMHRRMWKRVG